jgi:hypothetical protein
MLKPVFVAAGVSQKSHGDAKIGLRTRRRLLNLLWVTANIYIVAASAAIYVCLRDGGAYISLCDQPPSNIDFCTLRRSPNLSRPAAF